MYVNPERSFRGTNGEPPSEASQLWKGGPVVPPEIAKNLYCITLYFRGRKISRKVNLKYFREKIFSRIYCSRENIFPRKYLLAKISSRENIFLRKYVPAKIVCLFCHRSFLFAVCCPVIGDTGSRPNIRSWIRIRPAQQWHNSYHFESRSFLYLADEKHSAHFLLHIIEA